jgi:predicted transcriptional regulator
MTEGKYKKCGFVVDLNIHRVIETSVINYASLIKPKLHPREATKFILQERLINLNGDHWMPSFGNDVSKITALCENVYEMYSSNTENAINHFLNRLRFKEILLSKEDQKIFNVMFSNTTPSKAQKELIDKLLEEDVEEEKIKKGIEKTKVDTEEISSITHDDEDNVKQINYMDILKHIIPLICILTIHDNETSFVEMFQLIESDEYVYNILIDQTKSWWGKSIDVKIIKRFINVYLEYMKF